MRNEEMPKLKIGCRLNLQGVGLKLTAKLGNCFLALKVYFCVRLHVYRKAFTCVEFSSLDIPSTLRS